ncbi:armadillo-type protein [Suillus subaureus]|uniref:Armadillo-type protein n=1 Tax=Suillus subaureus TaxID=48587 RepID=A0A9P7E0K7_9AGAM|nr:armadillo-type protein [Suillus subaureus]KAG1808060.1 armadillo-type protein [Suillus subaureus]
MSSGNFLPDLSPPDVQKAAQLIQQAYSSAHAQVDQRRIQQELVEIQRRPEAWGLIVPFIEHPDPNVQFFGAHTAQVKIMRDWDSFPEENAEHLRDLLLKLTSHSILTGKGKVVYRKLFVAITSLALRIAPGSPSRWPDWIVSAVNTLSSSGMPPEQLLAFLTIVAEEVETADLLGPSKMQMHQSLLDASPMVVQAVITSITRPTLILPELQSALKCFQAWIYTLRANDITPIIPLLITIMMPSPDSGFDGSTFSAASDVLQEIMTRSSLAGGAGTGTLTEPLLIWLDGYGDPGSIDGVSHSLCKLLVALGDHSTMYFASNITSLKPIPGTPYRRAYFVQKFLHLLLKYTGLQGYYGVDEEESEMTLGFWYLFQESLWSVEYEDQAEDQGGIPSLLDVKEKEQWAVVNAVYVQLVEILRRKVMWPDQRTLSYWAKEQRSSTRMALTICRYRRDVGDTLINAYYILRNDMLGYFLEDMQKRFAQSDGSQGWEEIEATLHCIMSIQEAVPLEDNPFLARLFGPDVLGRLPTSGQDRIRRTMLGLIAAYSTWFTKAPTSTSTPSLLMNAISYVVAALPEPALCLPAANGLRDLCDANRAALAPHIGAFAELHAGLSGIPDTEKSKVLQSIASVIQALPPEEEIPPIQAIVNPVVEKLAQVLHVSSQLVDETRIIIISQLQTLSGVAKGLTRTQDSLLILDESPEERAEAERLQRARDNYTMAKVREDLFNTIRNVATFWSTDAGVSDALSDFFRSITSLPSDITLLSLPAAPIFEIICLACQRQLTAVWLSLATMLVIQLDPPVLFSTSTLKPTPSPEALGVISTLLPVLLEASLGVLGQPGAMEANPDIVQAFFGCMDTIAKHFLVGFYRLPPGALDALMQCAVTSLSLQERYSLVATCTFLETLIRRTASSDDLGDASLILIQGHGRPILRAILCGFAGVAPRSATQNLIELLSIVASKFPAETRTWMTDILFADDFVQSKAGPEAKRIFVKAIIGSRSPKKTREAAQQFTLVARGLEGTSFGYASVNI